MSKDFNSTSPQESAKIIADIEAKTTVAFPKDPGKAFELLDEFYKERKGNNITASAIQTVHRVVEEGGNAEVQSSFIHGKKSPYRDSEPIDENTTIAVGSVTKMFTSAALLKLWDQELTAKKSGGLADGQTENFPDGIDTGLSHFMAGLKAKFPDCSYLTTIEEAPHYPQVTLRDLLNHTHALGSNRDDAAIAKVLMDNPDKQFSCAETVQFLKINPDDKFGEFKYGSLGTELSGMIMELVTGETYGQVLQDAVLDPVGATRSRLKNVSEIDANSTLGYCYITPMELGEGESKKEYSGEINFNTSGNGVAAGGLKTTPEDADKFIRKFLSKEAGESSLFENAEVVAALFRDEGKAGKHNICGVNNYRDGTFGHNGDNGLSESSLKYNPTTGESFYYAAVGETLTYAVAYEMISKQKEPGTEIAKEEVFLKQEELLKAGFGFEAMKSMVDQGVSFGEIAENLNAILGGKAVPAEVGDKERPSFVELITNERKAPLVIYIAESDHADATYASLVEQMIKNYEKSGRTVQTFSEFPSQSEKNRTQGVKNKTDEETYKATTEFLSAPVLTKMGDLQGRESERDKIFERLKGKRSSELREMGLEEGIDSPELKELFKKELEQKIKNGDAPLETKRDFEWWLGGFYSAATHARMAEDVKKSLKPEVDVVIIVAGSPHIPSLGALLRDEFSDRKSLVVTNPSGQKDFPLIHSDSTPELLSSVGEVIGFKMDGRNRAVLPSEVGGAKYPHDLSTIIEANSQSLPEEKEREGWIMSVSKSFCGATAALMAVEGKFGEKRMEATVLDVLQVARECHPEREAEIAKYEKVLTEKGCEHVTLAQLLSHRNGLISQSSYFTNDPQFVGDNPGVIASDSVKFMPKKVGTTFSYGNPTFMLAEDLMSLVSDLGSYRQELKTRTIDRLGLAHTRPADEMAEPRKVASDVVKIAGVIDYDTANIEPAKESSSSNPLTHTQTGEIPLSAGGLCSSIADLEKFSAELAKMICGMPNALTSDHAQAKEVRQLYLNAFDAGEHCVPDGGSDEKATLYAASYSLGIMIGAINDKAETVSGRKNGEDKFHIWHIGHFTGNASEMHATMPFSFDDFRSGRAAEKSDVAVETDSVITQTDAITKQLILTMPGHDYAKQMDEYFLGKTSKDSKFVAEEDGECWRKYWQHLDLSTGKNNNLAAWQKELAAEGKLPKNFADFHTEIIAAYAPAHEALRGYLVENFIDKKTGIIDRDAIAEKFKTAEDFENLHEEVLAPHLDSAQGKTQEIFVRSEIKLVAEREAHDIMSKATKSWAEKVATPNKDDSGITR